MTNRINPDGRDRIQRAFANVDMVLKLSEKNPDEAALNECCRLLREASNLLQTELDAVGTYPMLESAIADLRPHLVRYEILAQWDNRN